MNNKEVIEIPLRKATYEELQQVICELDLERFKINNQVKRIRKNLEKLFDTVLYEEIYKEKNKLKEDYNMTISELREKFIESMINGGNND